MNLVSIFKKAMHSDLIERFAVNSTNLPRIFLCVRSRDRLVVRTLRCGRSNPGSNPGLGIILFNSQRSYEIATWRDCTVFVYSILFAQLYLLFSKSRYGILGQRNNGTSIIYHLYTSCSWDTCTIYILYL
jgi:hypothetical protein